MKIRASSSLLLAIAIVAPAVLPSTSGDPEQAPETPMAPLQFAVGLVDMPHAPAVGSSFHGAHVLSQNVPVRFIVVVATDPDAFRLDAASDPNVRYVMEDPVIPLLLEDPGVLFAPNDPMWNDQYGPQQIRAPLGWDLTLGEPEANVCIVDTGVRYTHEEIAGPRWLGGHDFVNNDNDPWDDHFHGTHVAGTAAGSINNGKGIAGMANVGIYGVKVLNAGGSGTWTQVADGITWCADNAPTRTVISMSLGGGSPAPPVEEAVAYAYETKGLLVVAAAGNSGCDGCIGYPAKYPQVMAVTCTNEGETLCGFSSTGPEAEIAAPGSGVLSSMNGDDSDYGTLSGTSMSTPHVSGAAALVWSTQPCRKAPEIRAALQASAQDLGAPGRDNNFGYGEVDVPNLFEAVVACTSPRNVTAIGGPGPGQITLSWDPSPMTDLLNYQVYRGTTSGGPYEPLATLGNVLKFTDAGLGDGVTLYYRVTGINGTTESPFSNQAVGRSPIQPSQPLGVVVGPADAERQILVTWSPPADTGSVPLDSYHIYSSHKPDGSMRRVGTVVGATQFLDDRIPDGKTRYYRVSAENLMGEGPLSDVAGGTTAALPTPPIAVDVETPDGAGQVPLVWHAPINVGAFSYRFDVYRSASFSGPYEIIGSVDADRSSIGPFRFTDATAPSGVSYFVVTTNNFLGSSSPSNVAAGQPLRDIAAFYFDTPEAPWTFTGLWHATTCQSVSLPTSLGYNRPGCPTDFDTGSRTAGSATSPDLVLPPGLGRLTLRWWSWHDTESGTAWDRKLVGASGDAGATWNTVHEEDGNMRQWNARSVDLSSFAGSPTLRLRLFFDSIDNIGNMGQGWYVDDVVLQGHQLATVGEIPQSVRAIRGPQEGQVTVTWDPPQTDPAAITGYRVYVLDNPGGPIQAIHDVAGSTSFLDTGLAVGATRYYRVSAVYLAGEGPLAAPTAGRSPEAPGAPRSPVAGSGPGAGEITLGWTAPLDDGGLGIAEYRVYRSNAAGGPYELLTAVPEAGFTDTGLPAKSQWFYRIAAVNNIGEGPLSAEVSATSPAGPSRPELLFSSPGPLGTTGEIRLMWDPPTKGLPITEYRLYRNDGAGYVLYDTLAPALETYADTGLQTLKVYYYYLTAVNAFGEGDPSWETCNRPSPWVPTAGSFWCTLPEP